MKEDEFILPLLGPKAEIGGMFEVFGLDVIVDGDQRGSQQHPKQHFPARNLLHHFPAANDHYRSISGSGKKQQQHA